MDNAINVIEDEAIDVSDYYPSPSKKRYTVGAYDKTLCDDNKQLKKFLDKCILLDPTFGMENIINKVLLPAFVCADEEYKKSNQFQRVLVKALKRLIQEPNKKYSHISDVLDTLKLHMKRMPKKVHETVVPRKKVDFITLSNTVSNNLDTSNRKRHKLDSDKVSPKKPKLDVIAIDDEEDDVIPIYDEHTPENGTQATDLHKENEIVDEAPYEIQDSQDVKIIEVAQIHDGDQTPENDTRATDLHKENEIVDEAPYEIQDSQEVKIIEETQIHDGDKINTTNDIVTSIEEHEQDKENLSKNENNESLDNLLVPLKEIVQEKKPEPMSEAEKNERIKKIEAEIDRANKKIKELELAEVTDDSAVSPYIQCSKLEHHIVKLHKELCSLIDKEPVKTRKVRLQVNEGQPEGPVRRLERFLNKNVDEDGVAPFPDFNDVVQCVVKANVKDGLGWTKAKILREAQAMFSYCGRALQKRRQEREWRHLRARLPAAHFDDDPAERDPELRAKLELHKQLAAAKEAETLERFSRMESMAAAKKVDSQSADTGETHSDPNISNETMSDSLIEPEACTKESNNNGTFLENDCIVQIKQEPEEFLPIQYKGDVSLVIEISESDCSEDEL